MAGARANGPVDVGTLHGRLRAARLDSSFTAQQLAEALGLASAQSIYDYENPKKAASPSPEALGLYARLTGRSLAWIIYGEEDEESPFIAQMKGYEARLDRWGVAAVLTTAEQEARRYAEQSQDAEFSARVEQMLAVIPTLTREQAEQGVRAVLASQGSVPAVHEATEEALPRPVSRARA